MGFNSGLKGLIERIFFYLHKKIIFVLFYINKIIITKYDLLVRHIATCIGHRQATVKRNGIFGFF